MDAPTSHTYVIGLGSNLGSRAAFLRLSTELLRADGAVQVEAVAPFYETVALGDAGQPKFLNGAVLVRSEGAPEDVLLRAQSVERCLGRERRVRWGARTVDLDILWWSGGGHASPELQIPHPALLERDFALAPLLDVLPAAPAVYRDALRRLGGYPSRECAVALLRHTSSRPDAPSWEARAASFEEAAATVVTAILRRGGERPRVGGAALPVPRRLHTYPAAGGTRAQTLRAVLAGFPSDLVPFEVALGPEDGAGVRVCYAFGARTTPRSRPVETSYAIDVDAAGTRILARRQDTA